MGVYVKGMYMPPSCYFCPMTNDGLYLCKANNPYQQLEDDCEERRPDWCPLVPVPEHGRLIDADALRYWADDSAMIAFDYVTRSQINAAPTIIPASEEGE